VAAEKARGKLEEEKEMPDFTDPFGGNVPGRKLTTEELIRAIRLNIAAEHEAIGLLKE
jgi:hypothetical protein